MNFFSLYIGQWSSQTATLLGFYSYGFCLHFLGKEIKKPTSQTKSCKPTNSPSVNEG